jgi:ankyrin repeat protein
MIFRSRKLLPYLKDLNHLSIVLKRNDDDLSLLTSSALTVCYQYFLFELQSHIDFKDEDEHGYTLFHLLARYGSENFFRVLMDWNSPEFFNPQGYTPSLLVVQYARRGLAQSIMMSPYLTSLSQDGWSLIHVAVRYNQVSILKELLTTSLDPCAKTFKDQSTPLHLAAQLGHLESIQLLLTYAPHSVIMLDSHDYSPLHFFYKFYADTMRDSDQQEQPVINDEPVLLTTLQHLINLIPYQELIKFSRYSPLEGQPLLNYAVLKCSSSLVNILMKANVPFDILNQDRKSLLIDAISVNKISIARSLIENKIHLNTPIHMSLLTPLMHALLMNNSTIAQLLIDSHIDLEKKSRNRRTALHYAVDANLPIIVDQLIERVDINVQDKWGNTPLHLAVKRQSLSMVQSLLHAGSLIDMQNRNKDTALHFSVKYLSSTVGLVIIQGLLTAKFSVTLQNKQGKTPFDYAFAQEKISLCLLLLNLGTYSDNKQKFLFTLIQTGRKEFLKVWLKRMYSLKEKNLPAVLNEKNSSGENSVSLSFKKFLSDPNNDDNTMALLVKAGASTLQFSHSQSLVSQSKKYCLPFIFFSREACFSRRSRSSSLSLLSGDNKILHKKL